jgi:hypothetical protein
MKKNALSSVQAFHLRDRKVEKVESVAGIGTPLPESLVISPGVYHFSENAYEMKKEGLYRFISPATGNQQRIVFHQDRLALMSSISWIFSHGYRDNPCSFAETISIATRGKVVVTCADACKFVIALFTQLQIRIRRVRGRTLQVPNGYNDGHILTEIQLNGRWIIYDPDRGMLYRNDDQWLGLLDLTKLSRTGHFEEVSLGSKIPVAVGHFSRGNADYDLWMETWLARSDAREELLCRPVEIPIISDGEKEYYTAFTEAERQHAYELWSHENLTFLSPEEFQNRFYQPV